MKFQSLKIHRTESYENPPRQLVGIVELVDENKGKLSIALDHNSIIDILGVIKTCVSERSKQLAKDAPKGLVDSIAEVQLAQDVFLSLPSQE